MSTKSKIRNAYFMWLFSSVNSEKYYMKLSRLLDNRPFRWIIHNDGNREQDAIREREIFVDTVDHGYGRREVDELMESTITVFEVTVALCKRMDFELDDLVSGPRVHVWFAELLNNLELGYLVDANFRADTLLIEEIDEILDRLLDRTYDYNGNGSFFPLKKRPEQHMANIEMWYQMMLYLDENYETV